MFPGGGRESSHAAAVDTWPSPRTALHRATRDAVAVAYPPRLGGVSQCYGTWMVGV